MKHWKKRLFTAAALVAALPIALGQSAPVAAPVETRAVKSSSKSDEPASADRAYLGVYPGTDSEGGGVKLEQVIDGSPAAMAGLQSGDVITAFGDRTVGSDEELRSAIASHKSGDKVKITYLRDGEKRRTSARLTKAPSESDAGGNEDATAEPAAKAEKAEKSQSAAKVEKPEKVATEKATKGAVKTGGGVIEYVPSKDGNEDAGYMGVMLAPTGDGRTSVSTVFDGSPAQKAGMQAGDVILKIDGEEAESADEVVGLVTKHHAGDKVTVTVERDGKPQKIKVKLSARSAANLGGGAGSVGGLAAPVPSNPEPKSVPVAPRTVKPRGRVDPASTGDASNPDAMRKEVDGMRVELEHMRRSMEELKQKCESQQRTIEKIRHALEGNDEPGSLSYGGSVASMGGATTAVALPSELAPPAAAAVATPDGGGAFVVDGGQGAKPMVIQLDGDEQIHDNVKVIHVRPHSGAQTIQLDGGDDKNVVNGKVIHVKPQAGGQTIQLVIDDGEGDEGNEADEGDEGGGESCCAGVADGTVVKKVVVVHGAPGKNGAVMQLGGDAQVRGKVVHLAPVHGGMGGGAMKVAQGPNGVTVYGRVADEKSEGGCCGGCGCCKEHATAHAGVGSGAPGMSMGGMPGMGTFELVPAGPGGGERPMRARMHAAPGTPIPPAPPMAPRGPMKFQMKAPPPPPQPFPQMAGGGTMVWKCDGPCELTFNSNGAQFHCEGSCEISQSTNLADATTAFEVDDGSGDFTEDAGTATLMFGADGEGNDSEDANEDGESSQDCEGCEHEGSCSGCEESGDGDSEHEDGDEDDDDDASTATPASIALPAI
jgi:S1-C subfamily serine protease